MVVQTSAFVTAHSPPLSAHKGRGIAFETLSYVYDALADNESALEVMGNGELRLIASELVTTIRDNSSVDWWRFEQRRTQIRVAVKRILRKYGYPPDLQEEAIKTVVLQAEALAMEVAA